MVFKRNGFSLLEENTRSVICSSFSCRRIAFCISIDTFLQLHYCFFIIPTLQAKRRLYPFSQTLPVTVRQSGAGIGFSSNRYFGFSPDSVIPAVLTDAVYVVLAADSVLITHWETSLSYRLNGYLSGRIAWNCYVQVLQVSFRSPVGTSNTWLNAAGTRKSLCWVTTDASARFNCQQSNLRLDYELQDRAVLWLSLELRWNNQHSLWLGCMNYMRSMFNH